MSRTNTTTTTTTTTTNTTRPANTTTPTTTTNTTRPANITITANTTKPVSVAPVSDPSSGTFLDWFGNLILYSYEQFVLACYMSLIIWWLDPIAAILFNNWDIFSGYFELGMKGWLPNTVSRQVVMNP